MHFRVFQFWYVLHKSWMHIGTRGVVPSKPSLVSFLYILNSGQNAFHILKIHWCLLQNYTGTDDDLPPSHQNRIHRGGRVAGNGRPPVGSVPYPRMYGDTDMEAQIHQLEQEAYSSVLRAFKAQADAITWVLCGFFFSSVECLKFVWLGSKWLLRNLILFRRRKVW